jgi:hypothetical protein
MNRPLQMKDRPGRITVAEMRTRFEQAVNGTPKLKETTPLGIMEINGEFSHYMDPSTDTMWIGFALGLRFAEREQRAIEALAIASAASDPDGDAEENET